MNLQSLCFLYYYATSRWHSLQIFKEWTIKESMKCYELDVFLNKYISKIEHYYGKLKFLQLNKKKFDTIYIVLKLKYINFKAFCKGINICISINWVTF